MWKTISKSETGKSETELVEFHLDGQLVKAPKNISVAAAFLQLESNPFRTTAISQSPRAPFCMMGVSTA
jgi:D-hydroxyproline dehydrogenase subunit gamma